MDSNPTWQHHYVVVWPALDGKPLCRLFHADTALDAAEEAKWWGVSNLHTKFAITYLGMEPR